MIKRRCGPDIIYVYLSITVETLVGNKCHSRNGFNQTYENAYQQFTVTVPI